MNFDMIAYIFLEFSKKRFTFSTPKRRMPYALTEANFKKRFTCFVVIKSWKTQITDAVQSKNFYFLLASIQIPRARELELRQRVRHTRGDEVVAGLAPVNVVRDHFSADRLPPDVPNLQTHVHVAWYCKFKCCYR